MNHPLIQLLQESSYKVLTESNSSPSDPHLRRYIPKSHKNHWQNTPTPDILPGILLLFFHYLKCIRLSKKQNTCTLHSIPIHLIIIFFAFSMTIPNKIRGWKYK